MIDVVIVLGTYNRLALLQAAIASIRRSCGSLSYTIIVVDGGSDDGTREWLADQEHVVTICQGKLLGAVRAFNAGFSMATIIGSPWVVILNDDDELIGPEPEIQRCVEMMRADESIGAVAFEANLRGKWQCECWRDKPSCGKGVVRRETLMAVARAQGDPEGRKFWSEEWETYAADSQAGCLIHKLGWRVLQGVGMRVDDKAKNGGDELRKRNVERYLKSGTAKLFTQRWGHPGAADYSPEFAREFGGFVRE